MHNETTIVGFIKRAQQCGLHRDVIVQIVADKFGGQEKQAQASPPTVDSVVTSLLADACLPKTAQSTGFVEGLLVEALDAGANFHQAVKVAEDALAHVQESNSKHAAAGSFSEYSRDFLKAAMDAGYTGDEAKQWLRCRIKQAGMPDPSMFKAAPDAGTPQAGMPAGGPPPGAGMPAQASMPPQGGPQSTDSNAAIMQLLQQHPELAKPLMMMLQSQQGAGQPQPAG